MLIVKRLRKDEIEDQICDNNNASSDGTSKLPRCYEYFVVHACIIKEKENEKKVDHCMFRNLTLYGGFFS